MSVMKTDAHLPHPLPQDVPTLQALVQSLDATINTLAREKQHLEQQCHWYLEQFKLAQYRQFARRNEKQSSQGDLFDEVGDGVQPSSAEDTPSTTTVKAHRRTQRRKSLPADLPRDVIELDVPDAEKQCPCCHRQRPRIGDVVTEKLDIIPMQLKVIQYVRPKYGRCCDTDDVVIAPLPRLFLPKSLAAPGLAAHVIVSKYTDHLPLYRQARIWKRLGVDFSRASMCRTVLKSAEYCQPLYLLLEQTLIHGDYVLVDETPVQVMGETGKKNTSRSYMWCYSNAPPDKPCIMFRYTHSREKVHPQTVLADFRGHVQCDGYVGYDWLHDDKTKTRGGCMAHMRRKFVEVAKLASSPGLAQQAIEKIGELYAIERMAREHNDTPLQRYQRRVKEAAPRLAAFKQWVDTHALTVPPRTALRDAFDYARNQWAYLITYLQDGRYEIDNNRVERLIRPFALGRKNWLFMGSPVGAHAGALFYSLIASANANQLSPFGYLRYVFEHIRQCHTQDDYAALLPFNVPQEQIVAL